jgi:quercetin dioxygenase-like cupin family protein
MSPVQRRLTGAVVHVELEAEQAIVRDQLRKASRSARTVLKEGPLRATLIGLAPGGEIASHSAEGPITVHVLEGAIDFQVDGTTWALRSGSLLALEAGVVHSVHSAVGALFLLTVALPAPSGTASNPP